MANTENASAINQTDIQLASDQKNATTECRERFNTQTENEEETVNWCRKAAKEGDAESQYLLGMLVYEGRGVQQDNCVPMLW